MQVTYAALELGLHNAMSRKHTHLVFLCSCKRRTENKDVKKKSSRRGGLQIILRSSVTVRKSLYRPMRLNFCECDYAALTVLLLKYI